MHPRLPALQSFLDSVRAAPALARADGHTATCVAGVFARLDRAVAAPTRPARRLPACTFLADAIRTATGADPTLARVAQTFARLEPSLAWGRRSAGGPFASENFADGHANAMVVGPGGFEDRDDVWVGVSLLAPGTRYPDHKHSPEEVYLVLSPGDFRQGSAPWFAPGIGGTLYNEPNIVHAMRSGSAPLFALWCLLPGQVTAG
jgi:hypothetical protein